MKETKKDPLRNHKTKDIIGAHYTIHLGKRLHDAMTEEELTGIFEMAYDGRLKDMREKAIYCDSQDDILTTPDDVFSPRFAKNLLLFCIESFDDALVG